MSLDRTEIRIKGKNTTVPSIRINDRTVIVSGKWVKVAAIHDEECLEGEFITDPNDFINHLRTANLKADIFTFAQALPHTNLQYRYPFEWENIAVVPLTTFAHWWESLPQESRKNVRRSQKRGVVVRSVPFDDSLVRGISDIYNETPIRQGRRFWHYGKALEQVKMENSTYLERSEFIGAFLGEELIGFLKLVKVDKRAIIVQILSKEAHTEKRTTNALLATAVEICAQKGLCHFIYGQYIYGNKANSPMTEFKRRNGFVGVNVPRYFVPLSLKGKLTIYLKLHRNLLQLLPQPLIDVYLKARAGLYRATLVSQRRERSLLPKN